jgi:hypothetical protein
MPASLESNTPLLSVSRVKSGARSLVGPSNCEFQLPILDQEFRFYHSHSPAFNVVEIVLNMYPQTPPVIPV